MDLNWERNAMKWRHKFFAAITIAILLILMVIFNRELRKEWMPYQKSYNDKMAEKLGKPELSQVPLKIHQIWLPKLDTTDRCTTCHTGLENPLFKDEQQPLTTHPGDIIRNHPIDKFGCTICHQGDGQAVAVEETHGAVHHLNRQLLVKDYVQSSCVKCHLDLHDPSITKEEFPSAAAFLEGKRLSQQFGCRGCHKIRGEGGDIGPELTGLGSKTELAFFLIHDFEQIEGPHTKAQWIYEHFINPQKVVPGNPELNFAATIMPNFNLTPEQATDLTIYVLGLRDPKADAIPYEYIAQKKSTQTASSQTP